MVSFVVKGEQYKAFKADSQRLVFSVGFEFSVYGTMV